jgi:hypothetical protein
MKTGDKVIVNDKGRFRQYTPDYANVDIKAQISRLEMKHGREVVTMALEEYLKESGASER